ncbi:hypothetical protein ACSFA3_21740 [Variovorax sp. RHLX14]|uniref:hypothetical protein n=1 Tax=Variovorax sp. RHLX14 TaxID=1259731 RepID=UPI003F48FBA4
MNTAIANIAKIFLKLLSNPFPFLVDGGEAARVIRERLVVSPLGRPETWSAEFKTALSSSSTLQKA